jgi:uncharacterized protein UPF0158
MKLSKNLLKEIAGRMEAGIKCYVHKTTHEIIDIPDENCFPGIDYDDEETGWKEEIDKVHGNPDYISIESMETSDSFEVMEDFALSLAEGTTKIRLITALEGYKPFANFNHQIHQSAAEREQWFQFRTERIMQWVKEQLERNSE